MSDLGYVVKDPHFTDMSSANNWRTKIPAIGLGAMALGAGGRLLKSLLDLGRGDSKKMLLPKNQSRVTGVPVEVGEDEAEELRRRGIAVKAKLAAAPEVTPATSVPVEHGSPSWLGAAGVGALGTGAAMGGWYLADKIVDSFRRGAARSDLDRVRGRIKRVLEDDPEEEDERLYGYMKAAEDVYFGAEPELQKIALGVGDLPWIAALALGGGTVFNLLSGYQESNRKSPYEAKANRLKAYLKSRPTGRPSLTMQPFVSKSREEDPELDSGEEKPAPSEVPVPTPAPVVRQAPSNSPADQAESKKPSMNWF